MTAPPASAVPPGLRFARSQRRLLRWTWLVVFVFGMALWIHSFDVGALFVVALGVVVWSVFGAVAWILTMFENWSARRTDLRARPTWGLTAWLLTPVVWGLCAHLRVDAHVWFVLHRSELTAAAAACRAEPAARRRLGGFDVTRAPIGDVVAFATVDAADMQGYLHDPAGVVRVGDRDAVPSGYRVRELVELGDGWRIFVASS